MTDRTEMTESEQNRLRLGLQMIGDEASRVDPATARRRPSWSRQRTIVAMAAGAAICLAVLVPLLSDKDPGYTGTDQGAGNGLTAPQSISCARAIVVGHVVAIRDASKPNRAVLTFAVKSWIKPARGPGNVEFNILDPRPAGDWSPGTRMVMWLPRDPSIGATVNREFQGLTATRKFYEQALPRAEGVTCPRDWLPDSPR